MEATPQRRRGCCQCSVWRYRGGRKGFFDEYGGDWPVLVDGDAAWAVAFSVLRPPESSWLPRVARLWRGWQGQITADEVDRVVNDLERENLAS